MQNEKSNVVDLAAYRAEREASGAKLEPAEEFFDRVRRANREKRERLAKERARANASVKRNQLRRDQ